MLTLHERRRREPLGICAFKTQFLAQRRSNPAHYRAQSFRRLCSDAKRVKMAEKPQKNGKESCKKDFLDKENIVFLWLGRVSKKGRIFYKWKRGAGNIRRIGEV